MPNLEKYKISRYTLSGSPAILREGYYYKEGEEYAGITGGWVEGYQLGIGSQSKEADHLLMDCQRRVSPLAFGRQSWETDNKVTLDGINTLHVEWECPTFVRAGADIARLVFSVNNNKGEDENTGVVRNTQEIAATFAKKSDSIDVSALTGTYHIRVIVRSPGDASGDRIVIKTYKIWGEE